MFFLIWAVRRAPPAVGLSAITRSRAPLPRTPPRTLVRRSNPYRIFCGFLTTTPKKLRKSPGEIPEIYPLKTGKSEKSLLKK